MPPHPPRDLTTSPRRRRGRLLPLAAVLAVADVLAPFGVAFAHRQVSHEVVGRGAVPVPLAPGDLDDVAGADGGDGLAAGLDAPLALGHIQRLADRVAVPGRARARSEVHRPDAHGRGTVRLRDG